MSITIRITLLAIPLSMAFLLTCEAEEPSYDEMVCALTGNCTTPFVDRRVRGLTTGVAQRPALSFDATVNFSFDSVELTAEAKKELDKIVHVLKDPKVKDADVIVAGHTDAKGSEQYNQKLSERRALMVKRYLVQNGIENKRLTATGYGKSRLLLPEQPFNALNRRVEFRNVKGVAATETIKPAIGDGF